MEERNKEEDRLEILENIIIVCVNGEIDLAELSDANINFDEDWWEVEGMCFLMKTDVFKLVKDLDIFKRFIGMHSMSSKKVRYTLINLIETFRNELKTSTEHDWREHAKMCALLSKLLENVGNLSEKYDYGMFEYIGTLMEVCEVNNVVQLAVPLLAECSEIKVECWLMQRLDWLMTQLSGTSGLKVVDFVKHRNMCEAICLILRSTVNESEDDKYRKYFSNLLDQRVSDRIFVYMMRLLDCEEHDRAKVMAIVNLELMCVTNRVDTDTQDRLRQKLINIYLNVKHSTQLTFYEHYNSYAHQVVLCARWCVLNILGVHWRLGKLPILNQEEGGLNQLPLVKLSPDRFEARSDLEFVTSVRSLFEVTPDVYYYEVVIITQGWSRIGWSSRNTKFGYLDDKIYALGDDEHSIGFDFTHGCFVHNNILHRITNLPLPQSPNVVGCLIDTHKSQFVFYFNGHEIVCPIDVNFCLSTYYYATASLYQQCHFNFGQMPFKYLLGDFRANNFNEAANGDVKNYYLMDTESKNNIDMFCEDFNENEVEQIFRDKDNEVLKKLDDLYKCKLIKLIINCLKGKIDLKDLRKCKSDFDEELWEVEGLCVLMQRDVFKLVSYMNIFELFIGKYSVTSDMVRYSLINLIDSLLKEMKTSMQHDLGEHKNMCWLLVQMEKEDEKVILNSDKIFDYIVTLLEMCEDETTVGLTVCLFRAYPTSKVKSFLIQRLDWLIKKLDVEVVDWTGHRNVGELIWMMFKWTFGDHEDKRRKYCSNLLDQRVSDRIFVYMMRLLDCEEHDRTKVMAIENLELLCVTNRVDTDAQHRLRLKLSNVTAKVESAALTNQQFNSEEHQVRWCASWCLDNMWYGDGLMDKLPQVKLSPDRFEARCNSSIFTPVRSSFGVTSGVFYYEVVLITQGEIRIGWSTRDAKLSWWYEDLKIGDDENSIAFDVYYACIVHNNISHQITNLPPPQSPNVVGCLIDTHNRQFEFYLNGRKMVCPIDFNFSTSPYYATACLKPHQQCRFNFGQEQFKYPPQNIIFEIFKKVSNGDARKYQLIDTEDDNRITWFKHSAVDNQVDLWYRDTKQLGHDDFVQQNEHHIANNQKHKLDLTLVDCNRFIQSVIEVMHTELNDDECIRQIMTKQLSLFENREFFNFITKTFELIYPYTQLQLNPENNAKCHNLGIILISILNLFPDIPHVIYQTSLNFLLSTKLISIETLKRNAQLVTRALSGFDGFKINQRTKRMLLINQTFTLTLKEIVLYEKINISDLYKQKCGSQSVQAAICAKWWIDQLFSDASEELRVRQATLNPTDRSAVLKLSSDRLSARSDCHWQSVRSIDHVPSDLYYFEVILFTDGPMRIGWATRRTDLNESKIGKDHFSISFDGFTRALRHQGEVYQVGDIEPWKAGDVIGCAIDKTNGQFSFSLNGQSLSLPPNLHFSSLPYHAAVSLSSHQQVYVNFGQAPFKYSPQHIDYWDFHLALSYRDTKPAIDFGNAKLKQAVISINSTVNTKNISFQFAYSKSYPNKRIKPNLSSHSKPQLATGEHTTFTSQLTNNVSFISRPRAECRLCTELFTTKLLRFVCCPNLILCLDCLKRVGKCPKCSKQPSNSQSLRISSSQQVYECRLCFDQTQTRVLRFLCCDAICLCLDCFKLNVTQCPKCSKQPSKNQTQFPPQIPAPTYPGLSNLGNTCFINSILQCLQQTSVLSESLLSQNLQMNPNGSTSKLLSELIQLFQNMKFPSKLWNILPNSIVDAIFQHMPMLTKGRQEDAHEFLVKFLEILHADLNSSIHPVITNQSDIYSNLSIEEGTKLFWTYHKIQNKSIISELFDGLQLSTTRCDHCDHTSQSFEPFNCLSLSIPSLTVSTIDNCIKQYTEKESFVWTCPKCSQIEATKWISLIKLPEIFIMHLKRFELLSTGLTRKLTNLVNYPLDGLSIDCAEQSNVSYNLYGIVEHVGQSMAQGHYIAFCQNVDINIPWQKFDDINVSPVTKDEAAIRTAYILFYHRTNIDRMEME